MIRTLIAIMKTKTAIGPNSGTTTMTNSVDTKVPPIFSNLTIIGPFDSEKVKSSNPPPTVAVPEVLWISLPLCNITKSYVDCCLVSSVTGSLIVNMNLVFYLGCIMSGSHERSTRNC